MISFFRQCLCYVLTLNLILAPLATAVVPTVPVSDVSANLQLAAQIGLLTSANLLMGQLIATQTETNNKLDTILSAIKYTPKESSSDTAYPTTDTVLIEFASSLYAAYTGDASIAYTALKEAQEVGLKRDQAGRLAVVSRNAATTASPTTPTTGNGPTGNIDYSNATTDGTNAISKYTANPTTTANTPGANEAAPSSFTGDNTVLGSIEDGSMSETSIPTYNSNGTDTAGSPALENGGNATFDTENRQSADTFDNNGVTLDQMANFSDKMVTWSGNLTSTAYNLQNLSQCQSALDCTSSGLTAFTGLMKTFNIQMPEGMGTTIGYIGAGLSFVSLIVSTFSGGFDTGKLLQFINGVQQNLLFASLSKGGLIMANDKESKIIRIVRNFTTLFGFAGIAALGDTNALAWLATVNNFSQPNDVSRSGRFYTDTPRVGTTTPTTTNLSGQGQPSTKELAELLQKMLQCNTKIAKTTAQCARQQQETRRYLEGLLSTRCAALSLGQQQIPALMFQELFTGTSNVTRCSKTTMWETEGGKELCPSIALLQATSLAERSVMSQLNVLIGLSMYNLTMTNINAEQVILQNLCTSFTKLIDVNYSAFTAKGY